MSKLVCQRSYDSKGVYCRELIDLFESKSCHNNGQCQRGKDNYKWHFSLNHIGKRYDIYQTPCFAQPYRNNERYLDISIVIIPMNVNVHLIMMRNKVKFMSNNITPKYLLKRWFNSLEELLNEDQCNFCLSKE